MDLENNVRGQTMEDAAKEYISMLVKIAMGQLKEEIIPVIDGKLAAHEKSCPTGEEFRLAKAKLWGLLIGVMLGSAGIGGTVGAAIIKLLGG